MAIRPYDFSLSPTNKNQPTTTNQQQPTNNNQ